MNKIYSRILWENSPSDRTPLNETNLNKMDLAIDNLDDRVVQMDVTKVNTEIANGLLKSWTLDETTGIITVEKLNGEQIIFDLNIEKIPVSFSLSEDGILTMITEDGTPFTANIGAMIPILTFADSDTIAVSVTGTGVNKTYSFSIKAGSVTEDKLQPNFLSSIKVQAENAGKSASDSSTYSKDSEAWAVGKRNGVDVPETDETYNNNAKYYMEQAKAASAEEMTGATAEKDGTSGIVPAPIAGQESYVLKGSGAWEPEKEILIDSELSKESENALQNKVIAEQIESLNKAIDDAKALRATLEAYGMVKLSDSAAVTDSTGLALPATEKNASLEGTLANMLSQLNTNLNIEPINIVKASSKAVYKISEFFRIGHIGWYNMWLEYDAIQGADIFEEIIFEFPEDIFVRYITGGACSAYGGAIHGSIDSLIYSTEHALSVRVAGAINTQNFIIYATGMFLIY